MISDRPDGHRPTLADGLSEYADSRMTARRFRGSIRAPGSERPKRQLPDRYIGPMISALFFFANGRHASQLSGLHSLSFGVRS